MSKFRRKLLGTALAVLAVGGCGSSASETPIETTAEPLVVQQADVMRCMRVLGLLHAR